MAKKFTVPKELTLDDTVDDEDKDLPQTAVKEKKTVQTIRDLQSQLAEYTDPEDVTPPTPANQPEPTGEDASWKKRYADLRRHEQKKDEKYQGEIKTLQEQVSQLTQASNQPMPKTKEEFLQWKEKYPDIAAFIEIIADEKAAARESKINKKLETVTTELQETKKDKSKAKLQALIPDLDIDTITENKEFLVWYTKQPKFVQDIIESSDDPEEVAYYLNLFKVSANTNAPKTPNSKPNKLGALDVTVKNSGSAPDRASRSYKYTTSQIQAMKPHEYAKHEKDIDEAERQGLIYDDMARKIRHTDL